MLSARLCQMRDERRDAGLTLMELVVSMALLMIVSVMAIAFFVGMNSSSKKTVDLNIAAAHARTTLQSWTTLLDLADSPSKAGSGAGTFVEITPTVAIFYTNINANRDGSGARSAPQKVSLSLESGDLVERDYSASTGSLQSTRHLASGVSRTNGAWIFTPYCASSTSTGSGVVGCGSTAAGSSSLASIVRVDIAFTLTLDSGGSRAFTSSASITGSSA